MLEAARSAEVGRVLTVTSADIYGVVSTDELPLSESAPVRPVSPYAASKAAADLLALQARLAAAEIADGREQLKVALARVQRADQP